MSTRAESTPTGDSIAKKAEALQPGASLTEIAKDLTYAHAHRPGLWQDDLDKVNEQLHKQNILPGVDIVGVRGQDLITKDQNGKVEIYDATDLDHHHAATFKGAMDGRATFNADGSGELTVRKNDNPWTISRDVLKAQGLSDPTDNQIANYTKELKRLNGDALKTLQPGDTLQLPPSTLGGYDTEFVPDRAVDKEQILNDKASKLCESAKDAINKFGSGYTSVDITKEEIETALNRDDITQQERNALQFLDTNYSQLVNVDLPWDGRQDSIGGAGIDAWLKQINETLEAERVGTLKEYRGL